VTGIPNFPQLITELSVITNSPVQTGTTLILNDATNGKLDTGTLGADETWTDISQWTRAGTVTRPSTREQGPLWSYQAGTMQVTLNNADGRFDPDNLGGPYVTGGASELTAMIPVRQRAMWNGTTYPLYWGFTDAWPDDGTNYGGRYAEVPLAATDGFKILAGINLAALGSPAGSGEDTGARITRILNSAGWYTGSGYRQIATGNSTLQSTSYGDTALNLMQLATDSEVGELYVNGSGQVVFRNRLAILTDTRSNTAQATFGDNPAGGELAYTQLPRIRDDTTLANDVQATRTGGTLQEVTSAASIATYRFPRTYTRDDLLLQDDTTALQWAGFVLYISKDNEDRFETITISPLRDPQNLWKQSLGREIGDLNTIVRHTPGVASPVTKDCFIRGITHVWSVSPASWMTTWTLQDATKYGSFLTLDNATLGKLDSNALAY